MKGNHLKCVTLVSQQVAKLGVADACRVLQHRLEHRLQIAWRAGDDLEHLTCCSLLLQRLGKLPSRFGVLTPLLAQLLFQIG